MTRAEWTRRVEVLTRLLTVTYVPPAQREQLQSDLDWLRLVDSLGLVTD